MSLILKDIATIIKDYMGLTSNQIWLKDEKFTLPTDNSFVVGVGFMSLKSFNTSAANVLSIIAPATVATYNEQLSTNMAGTISIDIIGRTFDVVTRHAEIIQAMNCLACKELQLKNGFLVAGQPSSVSDLSGLDGAAIPYRFQMTFQVQFIQMKAKQVLFYDTFQTSTLITEA